MYLDGHVVVRASWRRAVSRRQVRNWTLHRVTCGYLRRAPVAVHPAPADPYPGTVACQSCKPDLEMEASGNGG